MGSLKRWLPDTLRARLMLLLVVAVLVSHALALTLMVELRPDHGPHGPPHLSQRQPPHGNWAGPPAPAQSAQAGPSPLRGGPGPDHNPGDMPAGLRLGLLLDISVRLAALVAAAWWAARWLTRPVQRLSEAAQAVGQVADQAGGPDGSAPALAEDDGPREFREASRMFNQMQARIRQQLADRDRFVAAVSHDLRTPLTRLRLRTESLPDAADRERMGRDIAEMDAMITATLEHLRGAAQVEPLAQVDMRALLDSIADDHQDMGHAVTVQGQCAPLPVRPAAVRRCLDNLVGNAVRYGGSADMTLSDAPDAVHITVRDHGPGLPADELARVMEPFYRVEASRNRASGGVGLGLSIARDIALRHGGSLTLRNAEGGGLVALLVLSRGGAPIASAFPSKMG